MAVECGTEMLVPCSSTLTISASLSYSLANSNLATEDCKLVVTCKMQNRNATDKLNPQCSTLDCLLTQLLKFCGRITMLVYYIVNLANQLPFYFAFCK